MLRQLDHYQGRGAVITAHPEICDALRAEYKGVVRELEAFAEHISELVLEVGGFEGSLQRAVAPWCMTEAPDPVAAADVTEPGCAATRAAGPTSRTWLTH